MKAFPFMTAEQSAIFEHAVRQIVRDEINLERERLQRLLQATDDPEEAEHVASTLKGRRA